MKNRTPLTVCLLSALLLSSVFAASTISRGDSVSVVEGSRVYVNDDKAYISASPHTLYADGYVYLNVTSKAFGGKIDLCFGFDSSSAYPRSLEVYDPKIETIQNSNETQTVHWRSIRENRNFDTVAFSFEGMSIWHIASADVEKGKQYYLRMWLTLVRTLEHVTREFYVALKPHGETFGQALSGNRLGYLDPWYNALWNCRKNHTITSATGAGANYTVRIRVHYGSGTDSGEDVYADSKCRSDFGDIRFTSSDGSTLLNYWIETKTDGNQAVFWVKITDDISSSNSLIYVYYRNPFASTTSDGEDMFLFFDDFDEGFDTSKWDVIEWEIYGGAPMYGVGGGKLQLTCPELSCAQVQVISKTAYGNSAMHTRVYPNDEASSWAEGSVVAWGRTKDKPTGEYERSYGQLNGVGLTWYRYSYTDTYYARWGSSNTEESVSIIEDWRTYWDYLVKNDEVVEGYDSTTENTFESNIPNNDLRPAFLCGTTYDQMGWTVNLEVDWVFLRKYVDSEPGHGSWGAEEEYSNPSGRISLMWGVTCLMDQDEIDAGYDVSEAIEEYFTDTGDYTVQDYYGPATQRDFVLDLTDYSDSTFDFAAVFYKGHSLWGSNPPIYYLYDDDGGTGNNAIWDFDIGVLTGNGAHDFVFLWTCGMANEQGEVGTPTRGMSASWLHRDNLSENGYTNPDDSEHAFISFVYYSPWFLESIPEDEEHTYAEFVTKFYQYATDGIYTINEALDEAANDYMGCDLGDTDLYNGYMVYIYEPPMEGDYWCYVRVLGDGNMYLTT